jgi:hypothetical protein
MVFGTRSPDPYGREATHQTLSTPAFGQRIKDIRVLRRWNIR